MNTKAIYFDMDGTIADLYGVTDWLEMLMNGNEKKKRNWLKKHLASVKFDEIHIVSYGTPKQDIVNYPQGILFDDEEQNREKWTGKAFDEKEITKILKEIKKTVDK